MNFVDFVIDCYSHITSHVSETFASCTHYTSYSAKLGTLYCVWFCCGHPRLKVHWFQCKMCLMFVIWGQIDWKSWFWKIWVEFKCVWKTFHLILMHFFLNNVLWGVSALKCSVFQKTNFPNFWSIEPVARPIENAIKILVTICLTRSVLDWCYINQNWSSIDQI